MGHLLVVPVAHHICFGQVVRENSTEIADLLGRMLTEYERTFGPPTFLEHGSSSDMSASACVAHAHWHVVPVDAAEVNRWMVRDGLRPRELSDFTELEPCWDYSLVVRKELLRETMSRVSRWELSVGV